MATMSLRGNMSRKKHKPEIKMNEEKEVLIDASIIQPATENLPSVEVSELEILKVQIEIEKAKLELEEIRAKSRALSSREHDAKELAIVDKQITNQNEDKAVKEKIRSQKEYDNVKVTGRFMNRRAPGQMAKLAYIKYDDDPVKWYELQDGRTYTIPRGFADQINEHYHSPVFVQKTGPIENPDDPGSQIAEVDRSNKKYAFVAIGFGNERIKHAA
jgi:hypothetical protein